MLFNCGGTFLSNNYTPIRRHKTRAAELKTVFNAKCQMLKTFPHNNFNLMSSFISCLFLFLTLPNQKQLLISNSYLSLFPYQVTLFCLTRCFEFNILNTLMYSYYSDTLTKSYFQDLKRASLYIYFSLTHFLCLSVFLFVC